jgi:Sulfotransferase domain
MNGLRATAKRAWTKLPQPTRDAAKSVWAGYARVTARSRVLPDFLIIGTQRGGTTSLYKYLVQHPSLAHALTKELRFFDLNYGKGIDWYRSRFPTRRHRDAGTRRGEGRLVVGEASPDYLFHPFAAERVARTLPDVRLIVLLRNPVDRAWSHYWHQFKRGHETLPFPEALEAEPVRLQGELDRILADPNHVSYERHHHSYAARGVYDEQLRPWLDRFPREHLLVERSEDFFEDPPLVFKRVIDFLGLPDAELTEYETFNAFASGRMDPDLRARLVESFRPHNARLYDLLGRDFGWDS